MKNEYLIDTHYLLWLLTDQTKIPEKVMKILKDPENILYYSITSMWEVAIKFKLHKLPISGTEFMHYCEQAGYKKLPVEERHVVALETLELADNAPVHKDPFDRMLLAQAKADSMTFITHDSKFAGYNEYNVMIV